MTIEDNKHISGGKFARRLKLDNAIPTEF